MTWQDSCIGQKQVETHQLVTAKQRTCWAAPPITRWLQGQPWSGKGTTEPPSLKGAWATLKCTIRILMWSCMGHEQPALRPGWHSNMSPKILIMQHAACACYMLPQGWAGLWYMTGKCPPNNTAKILIRIIIEVCKPCQTEWQWLSESTGILRAELPLE